MNRRQLLQAGLATCALPGALSHSLFALPLDNRYLSSIGLQLWTVRNQMEEDVKRTLTAVKQAGYSQVELMNTLAADEIVAVAKDLGLEIRSAFIDWQSLGAPDLEGAPKFDDILEKAESLGLKYLVFGYIGRGHRETIEHYQGHAERANRAGEKCRAAGIQLCYHNHAFEFERLAGDRTGFDVLIERFDKQLVQFELDVFWAAIGGWDVFKTMRRLDGRIAQLHLKDLLAGTPTIYDEGKVPHDAFQELGDGTINMAKVVSLAESIGVKECHVEQDQSPDPIASIAQSMKHLKAI